MRIFTKKAFQFDHPTGSDVPVVVLPFTFASVPDWVADSTMFKLASSDGNVEVIESRQDEIAVESGGKTARQQKKDADAAAAAGEQL